MHWLLFYDVVPDYLERRAPLRAEHLALGRAAAARGELVLGGAYADPADGAVLLFRGESAAVAERFARADPYVKNGLVTRWTVRAWTTVVGTGAAVVPPAVRTRDAMEVLELLGARIVVMLSADDTRGGTTLLEYAAPPRYAGPPPHWHAATTELFQVLEGRLDVVVGEASRTLAPGDVAHVPPGTVHRFANPHDEPVRFQVQLWPGGFEGYFRGLQALVAASPAWPPADRSALDALAREFDTFPPPAPAR